MKLNTRQKIICSRLISSDSPVTLKQLSEELHISSRTVQRELKSVRELLQAFDLDLDAKSGVGIRIIGQADKRRAAEQYLNDLHSEQLLSQEERHYRLKKLLLSLNEPAKLFYLSSQLGVSEATISNDLAKLENWFSEHHLQLIRKPGFGVYIEGEEKQIRQAILELLYEQYSKEQLVYVLQKPEMAESPTIDRQLSVWNDLFHFIDEKNLRIIEDILAELRRKYNFSMTDSAFVGMVVHVALAVQRLKAGEGIEIAESILAELKQCSEFQWAKEVAGQLSTALEVTIPESEMGYITMHLLGSHTGRNYHQIYEYPTEEFARDMILIAGNRLNVSLVEDQDLFSHLTQHLVSALYRISMNMKIRNPLLSEVRINYPAEYAAACEAVDYLEKRTALSIPDEETGYLAMHFGAAVLRKERAVTRKYRVIVVCTSGIGTSRLLAAKIKKELPNLEVAAVVPLLGLEEFAGWESIDLVIATMNVDIEHTPVVEVSPFLTKEDCLKIETRLAAVGTKPSHAEEIISVEQMIRKMNTYGQAVSDILAHVQLIHGLTCTSKEEVIREAAYGALLQDPAADVETIMHDLLEREKMGIWMAKSVGLSLIHYRTKGIHKPVVSIYRLSEPVEWQDHETVHSVLVMLVPEQAPQEYLDMIGGISEAMIEEEVLKRLADGSEAEMKVLIQQILSSAYTAKAKQLIGAST